MLRNDSPVRRLEGLGETIALADGYLQLARADAGEFQVQHGGRRFLAGESAQPRDDLGLTLRIVSARRAGKQEEMG